MNQFQRENLRRDRIHALDKIRTEAVKIAKDNGITSYQSSYDLARKAKNLDPTIRKLIQILCAQEQELRIKQLEIEVKESDFEVIYCESRTYMNSHAYLSAALIGLTAGIVILLASIFLTKSLPLYFSPLFAIGFSIWRFDAIKTDLKYELKCANERHVEARDILREAVAIHSYETGEKL